MSGSNYSSSKETVDRLLNKFGRKALLIKRTESGNSFDPQIEIEEKEITIIQQQFTNDDSDFTKIKQTDIKMLIQSDFDVSEFQQLKDEGVTYSIMDYTPIKPGPLNILYKVHLSN